MAYISVSGIKTYYEKSGKKGKPVVLLHGWGQNTQMMEFMAKPLSKYFVVYNIDFPGFGKSEEPDTAWGCIEYTEWLRQFCVLNNIDNPIFIAHSFGIDCNRSQIFDVVVVVVILCHFFIVLNVQH